MSSKCDHEELVPLITKLVRLVELQGDAHSALMNQMGALHSTWRTDLKKLDERISFYNRPNFKQGNL